MLQEGSDIDDRLAEHIARLFIRDPVPSYEGEFIESQIDDDDLVSHFEYRDALLNQKFWFKTNCLKDKSYSKSNLAESDYLWS